MNVLNSRNLVEQKPRKGKGRKEERYLKFVVVVEFVSTVVGNLLEIREGDKRWRK